MDDLKDFARYMILKREHEYIRTGVFNIDAPTDKDVESWKRSKEVIDQIGDRDPNIVFEEQSE